MRKITVKYDGQCTACGKDLSVGDPAMYEKRTGIFCPGCEPANTEDIRRFRTTKAQKRSGQLNARADRLEVKAEAKMADFQRLRKDWAWVTQPGHIPGRDKVLNRYDKGMELRQQAQELREKAKGVIYYKARVKGDAEKKRQGLREAMDRRVSKGSRVRDFCFGEGVVVGVYKKSYRIKFSSGSVFSRDKSYVTPLT